jgi:cyclopropane fatty-acyl-phospholipid synthase-like methyltransferase
MQAQLMLPQMFEHMKNYEVLLKKVSTWLRPRPEEQDAAERTSSSSNLGSADDESLLFIHIFCHRSTPYHFEEDDGWMAQNFFSGSYLSIWK